MGVSADGFIIVGATKTADGIEACVWLRGISVMLTLGDFNGTPPLSSMAYGISADGKTVVGKARYEDNPPGPPLQQAFRWSESAGMVPMGYLYDANPVSEAHAASAEGGVIVGAVGPRAGGLLQEIYRWTPVSGMVELLPGVVSMGLCCSHDGSVIAGVTSADPGGAIIWDSQHGTQHLTGAMQAAGIVLPDGYLSTSAAGLSADGRTVVGLARQGVKVRAYLVDLP